jgi:hypothetical protein
MTTTSPRRFNLISLFSDRLVLGILLGAFVTAALFSSYAHFNAEGTYWDWGWLDSFAQNAGTEMLGAFLTFALIEVLVSKRRQIQEKTEANEERKQALIRQLGSRVHEEAIRAAEELRGLGWLQDGSLKGVSLAWANLEGANFDGADLQGADLQGANLRGADLWNANLHGARLGPDLEGASFGMANLQEADLNGANLKGSDFTKANLQRANLRRVRLQQSDLWGANLSEANLKGAWLQGAQLVNVNLRGANLYNTRLEGAELEDSNLQGANLSHADFDEYTVLPDESNWTTDVDLRRFTDPAHNDFWRSDYDESPAYRQND